MSEVRKLKPVKEKKAKRDRSRSPKRAAEEEVQVCKPVYTPTKRAVVSAFTTNPGQLRSFLNVPKAVLVQFPLKFVDNRGRASAESEDDALCLGVPPQAEPRVGLKFECVDASLSCMLFGHLQMQIYISPDATKEDTLANVDIAQLYDHVAVRELDEPIEIFRYGGDSNLHMSSIASYANIVKIQTLDSGDPSKTSFVLKALKMQYRVEIETAKLDKVAKIAALCDDTKWVRIDVYEAGPGDHCLLFKLKGDVGATCELVFKSVAHTPNRESNVVCFSIVGETVGPSVPDDEDRSRYKQVYSDHFDVRHLRAFVKGVLSATIVILIPAEEGKPLVLTSMFGDSINGAAGLSFVSQVQAPQMKEPNEDRSCDFFDAAR